MSDWTDQEESAFINFITTEANMSSTPVVDFDFSEKMKKSTESTRAASYLYFKLEKFKSNFHAMENFDSATKANVVRMLCIPEQGQKKQIARQPESAEPETSSKKDLPDELKNHVVDRRMLKFLAEKTRTTNYLTDVSFLKEFGEQAGNIEKYSQLRERYRLLKNQIHLATEYDKATRVKMLILSKTKISDGLLKDLRREADVAVDHSNRITEYSAFDSSFILKKGRRPSSTKKYLDGEEQRNMEKPQSVHDIKEEIDDYEEAYQLNRTTRSGRLSRHNSKYGSAQSNFERNNSNANDDEMEESNESYTFNTTTRSGRISKQRSTYGAAVIEKKNEKRKSEVGSSAPSISKRPRRHTEMSRVSKPAPSVPKEANRRMRVVDSEPDEINSADETLMFDSQVPHDSFDTMSATEADETISQESDVELTSVREFLSSLCTMVVSLNARTLVALEERIEEAVEQYKHKNDQISIRKLRPILEATLEMVIP